MPSSFVPNHLIMPEFSLTCSVYIRKELQHHFWPPMTLTKISNYSLSILDTFPLLMILKVYRVLSQYHFSEILMETSAHFLARCMFDQTSCARLGVRSVSRRQMLCSSKGMMCGPISISPWHTGVDKSAGLHSLHLPILPAL